MIRSVIRGGSDCGAGIAPAAIAVGAGATGEIGQLRSGLKGPLSWSKLSGASAIVIAASGAMTLSIGLDAGANASAIVRVQNTNGDAIERMIVVSAAAAAPTVVLTGALAFTVGAAAGTLVANIGGVPNGVTPTLTPNDGRLAIGGDGTSGWKVVVGLSASSVGTIALTVMAAGAASASADVTVTAAAGTTLPQSGALALRWSADDLPVQADNSDVSSWTDSVAGWAIPASVTAGSTLPKYRTNRINGKPSVQFAGTSRFALARDTRITTPMGAAQSTLMFVFRNLQAAGTAAAIFGTGDISPDTWVQVDGLRAGRYNGGTTGGSNNCALGPTSGLVVLIVTANKSVTPNRGRTFINGGCVNAQDTGRGGNARAQPFFLGAPTDVNAYGCKLELLDFAVWNGVALSQVDTIRATKWAFDKYATAYPWAGLSAFRVFPGDSITAGLGASHPEYSYPSRVAASMGLTYGQWTNLGVPSATWTTMEPQCVTDMTGLSAELGMPIHMLVHEYANERVTANAGIITKVNTFITNRKAENAGIKIALATAPRSTTMCRPTT